MPPWYFIPDEFFALALIAGAILRDRWIITAALIACCNVACVWLTCTKIDPQCAWAYCALSDLVAGMLLAWSMRIRGIVMGALFGLDSTFYLIIGAAYAFGDSHAQDRIFYHAWWGMEYLAFVICGALAVCGFDDHGGKTLRNHAGDYIRRARNTFLEGGVAHRETSHSLVDGEEAVIDFRPVMRKLHRIK